MYVCALQGSFIISIDLFNALNWCLRSNPRVPDSTDNTESREWRRRELVNLGVHPEHPQASTTDNVECFFSVMCDVVGTLHCKSSSVWMEESNALSLASVWTMNCLFTIPSHN